MNLMWTVLFTLTVALTASDVYAQAEFITLRAQGRAAYVAGKFAEGEKLLRRALEKAEDAGDDTAIAITQNYLGDVYEDEERFEDAELANTRALRLFRRMPERAVDTAATLRSLASVQTNDGRPRQALANLNRAVELLEKSGIEKPSLTAAILNSMAMVHIERRDFKKAERLLLEARQIRVAAGIDGNLADAQTANNLGTVYYLTRQYMKAEQWYTRALEVTTRLLGPSHPDLTLILANLGSLYAETGRYREAIAQFRRSLAILELIQPRLDGRIIRILRALSHSCHEQNHTGCAEATLGHAIDLARHTASTELPGLLEDKAAILETAGKREEALAQSMEARRVRAEMRLTIRVQKR